MPEMIQIIFERGDAPMLYRDALYLPADHTFTDAEIEAMKQERYDNWLAVVSSLSEVAVDG